MRVQCDASGKDSVVAYASRALSSLEKKYSQVEREALAVVYGCERFHLYIFGKPFKIVTDARAIAFIYNNPNSRAPARIEKWGLRLLPYEFEILHKPGKEKIADFLSRSPVDSPENDRGAEEYLNFIAYHAIPEALFVSETKSDATLCKLIELIGLPNAAEIARKTPELKPFSGVIGEMSVTSDGVILRKHQIAIPRSLEKIVVELAHEGHLGVVKTKQLIREKVWFPKLDLRVEHALAECLTCQSNTTQVVTKLSNRAFPNVKTPREGLGRNLHRFLRTAAVWRLPLGRDGRFVTIPGSRNHPVSGSRYRPTQNR